MHSFILTVFIIGYLGIAFEHKLKINKAAIALITGVLCWTIYIWYKSSQHEEIVIELMHHFGDISGILFFLLGAMTIVELIDAHDGFSVVTDLIRTPDKKRLMWLITGITFFMSAILDNLTTTIVMLSLLRRLVHDRQDRLLFAGLVVIAANAGGAWSPIGDVTTTMLWIGGQVTERVIPALILPSIFCTLIPALILSFSVKGTMQPVRYDEKEIPVPQFNRRVILVTGLSVLMFVPVFKLITHLPPFMGVLFGLGIMWIVSEILNKDKDEEDKDHFSIVHALRKIDASSILFFLGILLSISAFASTGQLTEWSAGLSDVIKNENIMVLSIGLMSALIDNVPLVAAAMGMYDLSLYPKDNSFWMFLAYCAGTGGSILIIGSAAGVAAMGIEKIEFFWYLKKIGWLALVGYLAGAGAFLLQGLF
jgi:Na+/H+ antiporter NhaD/arsenite permease-like protein